MAISELKGGVVDVKLWAPLEEVESGALTQLRNIASLPWVYKHVAAMPDVHLGKGATVGSVVAMKQAVAPAAVGVDIGCGMGAVRTSLRAKDLPDSLGKLRSAVERAIPVGFESHPGDHPWGHPSSYLGRQAGQLFSRFSKLDAAVQSLEKKAKTQIGTLGGGNHFIELCLDEDDRVWLMLHSGSRNIGKELAEIHIERAKTLAHNERLVDPELAVFLAGTLEMEAYRHDLYWAQEYAFFNRTVMFDKYMKVMMQHFKNIAFETPILCHHNYVAEEKHFGEEVFVTRKGAIRAGKGEMGIIPGSMGTKSYIVEGLGSEEAFESASHGAGRVMSRGQAKKRFTLEDLKAQTEGVECAKDASVLDEIPGAYKDIDKVMANQRDLVRVVHTLKQVMCVKGGK